MKSGRFAPRRLVGTLALFSPKTRCHGSRAWECNSYIALMQAVVQTKEQANTSDRRNTSAGYTENKKQSADDYLSCIVMWKAVVLSYHT